MTDNNDKELQKYFRKQNQKPGKYEDIKQDMLEDIENELSYKKQVSKRINYVAE